mgnify:CR=1 FL=1
MNSPLLRLENIHKNFGDLEVLKGIDLTLEKGKKVAVIGPSGCGKSTLLRCINYMEIPSSGHVYMEGELFGERKIENTFGKLSSKELAKQRSQIGMVFQSFNLWPHLTAINNVALGPTVVNQMPKNEADKLAKSMIEKVHLTPKINEYPERLSGGQQQRVAIARALAQQPKLMLFDEPTSALDPELIGEVLNVIQELASEGRSMVLVTHEINFARELADHIIFLHDGIIIEEGPPSEVIDNPKNERLKTFLNQIVKT